MHTDPAAHNLAFVEQLYAAFLEDPASVDPPWRQYFEQQSGGNGQRAHRPGPSFKPFSLFNPPSGRNGGSAPPATPTARPHPALTRPVDSSQDRVDQMVRAYRVRGHVIAKIDPLGFPRPYQPELDPEFYGFSDGDMDQPYSSRTIYGPNVRTLREIVQRLRNTYCRSIGVQYMHIDQIGVRHWLQDRMEGTENRCRLTHDEQIRILTRLTDAVIFEEFISKKYVGTKRFSLEGSESLIPLLDLAIEKAGDDGVAEIVLGMAHRGRLNVLANIMGKHPQDIFREFDDTDPYTNLGSGDVKYHLGHSTDWTTSKGRKVHLSLCFNPSHLEFVNPVVLGRVRAKQDRCGDLDRERGMALLIHGDAAFAGEGIVQETLNLSELEGYTVGGAIHVIVNNQIGFTTAPEQGRSSLYASGLAKMLQGPIFHVNGEDPEAVAQVIRLAMDFRKEFKRDVVIDMYGYRRFGHNEGDEPSFTHPVLYRAIEQRASVRNGYLKHLLALGEVTIEQADEIARSRRELLERELSRARSETYYPRCSLLQGVWRGYFGGPEEHVEDPPTGVDRKTLSDLLEKQTQLPADFHLHPKLERFIENRREMARGQKPLDWSAGEALAYATLAVQGHPVRISGQDSQRGTFSHRHAVLHDYEDGHTYMPLQHLQEGQAPVRIFNSPLSEAGVLGFEYGYSLDTPEGLMIWEAQFGDFVNVAQVIIDQFICSAEDKWQRLSGITMLLPHGFEGQGPEHSSGRLERFLGLCAEDNIQVCQPTTPAQFYHLIRRQVVRKWRKPLIVMTPKSMLRAPQVVSGLDEFVEGRFQRIIPDQRSFERPPERILFCTGKVYWDLIHCRESNQCQRTAVLRLEQLYPLSDELLCRHLEKYPDGTPVIWVQEEPGNMGAWPYLRSRFGDTLCGRWPLTAVTRPMSASPATGSGASHKLEQKRLIEAACGQCKRATVAG